MTQVRKGIRGVLEKAGKQTTEWTTLDYDEATVGGELAGREGQINEELWWILVDKTTGEALQRIRGCPEGQGIEAYRRLHQWHAGRSAATLQELRDQVMRPKEAKTEAEVAIRIEEWLEAEMELGRIDPGFETLPTAWRVSAIRGILTGKIKDHIDLKDAEGELGMETL